MEKDYCVIITSDSMDFVDYKDGRIIWRITWRDSDECLKTKKHFEFCPEQMTKAAAALLIVEMFNVIKDRNTWWDGLSKDTARFEQKMEQLGIFISE